MSQNSSGLLEYIPGSEKLLVQKNSSPPLEGFAENIRDNIHEYASIPRSFAPSTIASAASSSVASKTLVKIH